MDELVDTINARRVATVQDPSDEMIKEWEFLIYRSHYKS